VFTNSSEYQAHVSKYLRIIEHVLYKIKLIKTLGQGTGNRTEKRSRLVSKSSASYAWSAADQVSNSALRDMIKDSSSGSSASQTPKDKTRIEKRGTKKGIYQLPLGPFTWNTL